MKVTEKMIDDKRLELVENLQLLDRLKRRMHTSVYNAAIRAYARVLADDDSYVNREDGVVRTEFREVLTEYMIDICRFSEIEVSRLTKIKVNLNNIVDQILSGEDFNDNHTLFTSLGDIVKKGLSSRLQKKY